MRWTRRGMRAGDAVRTTLGFGGQQGSSPGGDGPGDVGLGSGFSQEPISKPSSPPRARVPYLLLKSPKPKAALGRMAFLPEKQGPSFKQLADGEKRRLVLTGRQPLALRLPNPASVGQIRFVQLRQEGRDKLMRHPHCPAEPREAFRCLLRKCHRSRDIKERM